MTKSDTIKKSITNTIDMKFVFIPPGKFMMGSPEDEELRDDDDERLHEVILTKGFYMQTTQVTVGQWKQFISNTGYKGEDYYDLQSACRSMFVPEFEQQENHPVVCLSWNDTQTFIEWLCHKDGRIYRLPYEAEWEYACRAGTATRYYTGDTEEDLGRAGWHEENSGYNTHNVGEKKINAFGLYDMHGNVCEWCQDWYDDYPHDAVVDPTGPDSGLYKIFRGGSWLSVYEFCRSADRQYGPPEGLDYYTGFRLALLPKQ